MLIVKLYKVLLLKLNLGTISYLVDMFLCGGVLLCMLLDAILTVIIISVLVKIITKRTITYWMKKILVK